MVVSELIGSPPARGRFRGRKPVVERPGESEPAELPIRRVTFAPAERLDDEESARSWLSRAGGEPGALVDAALGVINRAIAAYRASAGNPAIHEASTEEALTIRIGFGTGDHVAGSGWIEAVKLPAERRHKRRPGTEDIRPQERMAAILAGREKVDPWELHALRAREDFENERPAEAAAELRAAIASFDAAPPDFAPNMREEIATRLDSARAAFGSAPAIPGTPASDGEALADAVDLFERLQNRRRRPTEYSAAD